MTQVLDLVFILLALLFFGQTLFSLYLTLYAWEYPERLERSRGPTSYLQARLGFSVLLPARHEERVLYETISTLCAVEYPKELLEIVVICRADDPRTIEEARRAADDFADWRIAVEVFSDGPTTKPRALNIGLRRSSSEVVTVFDAEDDVDPQIFNIANTVMLHEGAGVVQAGVQIMNYRDRWFSMHNCLEYFFWFKSRLHFHAEVGLIPLGGNTVFMRRGLIEEIGGWDEACLTEDADIGVRLSLLGQPIRVVYDANHVTREEAPHTVRSFVRQRTRWQQGFLQVLRKGQWRGVSDARQRLLALYTFSYPLLQAALVLLWPGLPLGIVWFHLPYGAAMASFLPLYGLFFQFVAWLVGARVFAREYELRWSFLLATRLALTFWPFQILLGWSSFRAVARELRGERRWEKTSHLGAHRPALEPRLVLATVRLPGAED